MTRVPLLCGEMQAEQRSCSCSTHFLEGIIMFRQSDPFTGGWKDKTIEAMQRRRFDSVVRQLPGLGADRLENLSLGAFRRRLESCWQDVERKPIRKLQEEAARAAVLASIEHQADCLSHDEHELVERALILGGCAQIDDIPELEAATALSLRLWGSVGLVSGKPYLELDPMVCRPAAEAFARAEHEAIRRRFDAFHGFMASLLYRVGAVDDRQPQQMIMRDVFKGSIKDDAALQLARRYLWASYDCVDYADGVLLVHSALADPEHLIIDVRRKTGLSALRQDSQLALDILPEEIPLQRELERAIDGALRDGMAAHDVARNVRFLCKQGAPLSAMEEVLQASLIVYLSSAMRGALMDMYYTMPKWAECCECASLQ